MLKQKWPFRTKSVPCPTSGSLVRSPGKIKLQETHGVIFGYRNRNNTLDYQQTYRCGPARRAGQPRGVRIST